MAKKPQTTGKAAGKAAPSKSPRSNRLLIVLLVSIIVVLLLAFGIAINLNGKKAPNISTPLGFSSSGSETVPSGILMVNCIEDGKKGLRSPRISIEDGVWYYVQLQLLKMPDKEDAVLGKLAPKFAQAGKGTKKLDDYLSKVAAVQHNEVVSRSNYDIYTLMAGPFTYYEYKNFVSEMWTILVKLRYGRVDVKEKNGKAVLTTNYYDGIFSVQLFSPKWDTKPLERRQREFSQEVEKNFNTIMQNEADDSLAEIRRLNRELQR